MAVARPPATRLVAARRRDERTMIKTEESGLGDLGLGERRKKCVLKRVKLALVERVWDRAENNSDIYLRKIYLASSNASTIGES
jgi:hypothetical protein